MDFNNKFSENWQNEGTEPSADLKSKGFQGGQKPPAAIFNWFWSLVSKAITELQDKVFLKSGGTLTGSINLSNNKVTNLADPTADSDAANKKYADKAHLITSLRATNEVEGYLFLAKAQHTGWGSSSVLLSLQNGYSGKKFNSLVSIQVNGNNTELFTDFVQISGADITNRLLYVQNPDDKSISFYIQKDTYMTIYVSVLAKYGSNITIQTNPTYESELENASNAIYELGALPTPNDIDALPITGGTITGTVLHLGGGFGRFIANENQLQIETWNEKGNDANRRLFTLCNSNYKSNKEEAVLFTDRVDTINHTYKIYGEHNKPSGTFTGLGTLTSRTINIGGSGTLLVTDNSNEFVFVTSSCAFALKVSNGAVSWEKISLLTFKNGVLTTKNNESCLNQATTYYYQVL